MKTQTRNENGFTLPFALILTFIFSALVGVSFLFVSVNLKQMQSNLYSMNAIAIAEGINERVKARLNTKSFIKPSPAQEEKLKSANGFDDEEEDDFLDFDDEFDETTEDFDEYYADEVLKISRYITFREPPEKEETKEEPAQPQEDLSLKPEANVEMIGDIEIPIGTVLNPGIMIVVFKDEKIDLMLKEIVPDKVEPFREKLPIPKIKSLTPNYSEPNKRTGFVISGDNLSYNFQPRFNTKDIVIEDVKAGPFIDALINPEVMTGINKFYWGSAHAEFYVIPAYDGSSRPTIYDVTTGDGSQLFSAKAGQKNLLVKISGIDLYLKKGTPVVVPDANGIIPKVKEQSPNGREIIINLEIGKNVESGTHSIIVATEGGLSNAWLFNVLPQDKDIIDSSNIATVTSSLTLLGIRVVENLLPLIDEEDALEAQKEAKAKKSAEEDKENLLEGEETDDEEFDEDLPESDKLSPFANTDLETTWLLETSAKVGKVTKTVSEVIHRQIPNIQAALTTNGEVRFDGGGYQIVGASTAMTNLVEPTYVANTILSVEGPKEQISQTTQQPAEPTEQTKEENKEPQPQSPIELGFQPGAFVTVYKQGGEISELDYGVISMATTNTIELFPPGLMDFHYEGDQVFQFIPPVISKVKISDEEAEKHIVPKDFSLGISGYANSTNILRANLEQFSELADLYTSETTIPKDEFELPIGYMSLTYIDSTPAFSEDNSLSGKGLLIIDTRADNQGKPIGDVEIIGDSRSPAEFTGIIYVHGNLRIDGNVTINGAVIVDNESNGQVQITSNAIGRINYDPRAIQQSILYTPFTTKPGTIMISNKPLNLAGYVESGTGITKLLGAAPTFTEGQAGQTRPLESTKVEELPPEEALVETIPDDKRPAVETIQVRPGGSKSAEEELIDLF